MTRKPSFSGNSERVRRFRAAWDVPEVVWDERFNEPLPGGAEPGRAHRWPRGQHLYHWVVTGNSTVIGLKWVVAEWQFSARHEFEALELRIESALDPDYLAEKLSLAVQAAAFPGWQPGDLPSLHDWIGDLTATSPSTIVSGYKRLGFLLFDLRRFPLPPSGAATTMKVTLTDNALDGTPLDKRGGRR